MKTLNLLTALTLAGCAAPYIDVDDYLASKKLIVPDSHEFQTCRAYGCRFIDTIHLSKSEWNAINKSFKPKPKSAASERKAIKTAIARFETITGEQTGASNDRGGTFATTGHDQLDCVDESTNTATYLRLLQQRGLLRFHDIAAPTSRIGFLRWPHQTAVIIDLETNESFAVDSWFYDNGKPPEIVPLKQWKTGWKPPKDETPQPPQNTQNEG
ncbi:MAG: hypothetical protein ACPGRX_04045 [Bdellovibrionales bacterium]